MYDPDQQSPVLRLAELAETAEARANGHLQRWLQDPAFKAAVQAPNPARLTTSERLALAERQMEEAVARWSEAFIAWQAERRQSQPISAARPVGDGMMRYERPMVFRQNGSIEALDGFQPLNAPL